MAQQKIEEKIRIDSDQETINKIKKESADFSGALLHNIEKSQKLQKKLRESEEKRQKELQDQEQIRIEAKKIMDAANITISELKEQFETERIRLKEQIRLDLIESAEAEKRRNEEYWRSKQIEDMDKQAENNPTGEEKEEEEEEIIDRNAELIEILDEMNLSRLYVMNNNINIDKINCL